MPIAPLASADQPATAGQPVTNSAVAESPSVIPPSDAGGAPTLHISSPVTGVDIPWDVAWIGKKMLFTERDKEKLSVRMPDGSIRTLFEQPAGMWHSGETGLMAVTVDPDFQNNRRIYTCHGYESGVRDIRVVRWVINEAFTAATPQANVITGIEITSGRHGGCRLRFSGNGALYIGTGDSAVGTNPQSPSSPNGKVLRVVAATGAPWPTNPWISDPNPVKQKLLTYGHRNVQGLALRKNNQMWSVEHGTYRDDEVNKLKWGGNYGWNPVPGYDESKPMTDHSLPGVQINARWSSGTPTIATSGAAFLKGDKWGAWEGRLAIACLVGAELRLLQFTSNGQLIGQQTIAEFDGDYGRLRAVQMGPKQSLWVTTSNGGGTDRIIRIDPS